MPPKTAKHGGARKNGGRKSKSGEFSNDKTPEENLKSHRERMAKNRGQLKVPAARSDDGKDCESVEAMSKFFHEQIIKFVFEPHLGINFSAEKVAF